VVNKGICFVKLLDEKLVPFETTQLLIHKNVR